jgi:hypothetical protein
VSDDDRVALSVMHFGSPKSTGARAYWALPQASPPAAVPLSAAAAGPRKGAGGAAEGVGGFLGEGRAGGPGHGKMRGSKTYISICWGRGERGVRGGSAFSQHRIGRSKPI